MAEEKTTPENPFSVVTLPELPVSLDNSTLVNLSVSLLITGFLLILITYLFFRKI